MDVSVEYKLASAQESTGRKSTRSLGVLSADELSGAQSIGGDESLRILSKSVHFVFLSLLCTKFCIPLRNVVNMTGNPK